MISRYLLLLLFNLPFIIAGLLNIVTLYKLGHIKRGRFYTGMIAWVFILLGLAFAESIYTWLFSNNLTQTDSLSLFDVVQITAIVLLFYVLNRARLKLEVVERRLRNLHQEVSIILSNKNDQSI